MTNHPKFTRSHDSAARSVGYEGARESRKGNSMLSEKLQDSLEQVALAEAKVNRKIVDRFGNKHWMKQECEGCCSMFYDANFERCPICQTALVSIEEL